MTTRKRIQLVAKSGGGGSVIPPAPGGAVVWSPASGRSDGTQHAASARIALGDVSISSDVRARQAITLPSIATQMNTAARGAVSMTSISTDMGTVTRSQVRLQYTVTNQLPAHDFYIDENAPTSNFGSSLNLLAKTNGAIGNNRQFTILAWDFTGVSGTVSNARLRARIHTSLFPGENATYQVWTHNDQPYTESTANWNNSNVAVGTQRGSITVAVTNTPQFYDLNLDATMMANMPGNWLYLRCLGTAAVGAATITTISKETGVGSRPVAIYTVDV